MDADARLRLALNAAMQRLLRPLVRVLLRQSVPFSAFEEIAKQVYVDVAMNDFAIPGKKPSISRASILTGLTRKDVQARVAEPEPTLDAEEHYNRAARVLSAWTRHADYLDESGQPRALEIEGSEGFAALVRRHSGDMPARAVLDELLRVGAVSKREDGRFEPVARAYVPQRSVIDKIGILGSDVADLIETIDHNIEQGADDPRFQRKVMYHSIDVDALPAFRKMSATQAQALLERLDRWLATRDVEPGHENRPHKRIGVGVYYFEAPAEPAGAADPKENES
jgi:hypothetical protein